MNRIKKFALEEVRPEPPMYNPENIVYLHSDKSVKIINFVDQLEKGNLNPCSSGNNRNKS